MLGSTIIHAPDPSDLPDIADDMDLLDDYPKVELDRMLTLDFELLTSGSGVDWSAREPVFYNEEGEGGSCLVGITAAGVRLVLASREAAEGEFADDVAKLAAFVHEHGADSLYEYSAF